MPPYVFFNNSHLLFRLHAFSFVVYLSLVLGCFFDLFSVRTIIKKEESSIEVCVSRFISIFCLLSSNYRYDYKLGTFVSQPNRPMGSNPCRVLLLPSCPIYSQNMSLKAFNQLVGFPRKIYVNVLSFLYSSETFIIDESFSHTTVSSWISLIFIEYIFILTKFFVKYRTLQCKRRTSIDKAIFLSTKF